MLDTEIRKRQLQDIGLTYSDSRHAYIKGRIEVTNTEIATASIHEWPHILDRVQRQMDESNRKQLPTTKENGQ